jgi:xanthosine utilization system XapX-like protein
MIVIIIAIYLFEKIIPFSRNIKGIENGNVSYYRANTALNEALYSMTGANPGFEATNNVLSNGS